VEAYTLALRARHALERPGIVRFLSEQEMLVKVTLPPLIRGVWQQAYLLLSQNLGLLPDLLQSI